MTGPFLVTTRQPAPMHSHCGQRHFNACPRLWGGQVERESVSVVAVATLEERIVFDADEWKQAGGDQPDGNHRFYHHALILRSSPATGWVPRGAHRDTVARILWLHTGRVSDGHIVEMMSDPGAATGRVEPFAARWPDRLLTESGGEIELPDGTTITVEPTTIQRLAAAALVANDHHFGELTDAEVLAAFNAAQEAQR